MSKNFKGDVLIVEDNKINQMVLKKHLQNLGFTVTIAENGIQALEVLASKSFLLIFMDLQMPEMGGLECTREIRSSNDEKLAQVPIIAVTANVTDADRSNCEECGMNAFLEKPLNKQLLLSEVMRWYPN